MNKKIFKLILILFFLVGVPVSVNAANLSFSTIPKPYGVGDTFQVSVYVGSTDQAMNAASGVISFPWDKLQVVSLSKTGSIFSLWAEEPSFSNSQGTVSFEGIVLNPGFSGAQGKILTITFKARSAGQANLSFSSGSVLANDGTGTNILNDLKVSVVNINDKITDTDNTPEVENIITDVSGSNSSKSDAPIINSLTHPDQEIWYKNNSPEFSWELPKGVIEVRTSINNKKMSVPNMTYKPPISVKKVSGLNDGTYYFHLQVRTVSGWSGVGNYRVNIDTKPPKDFDIVFPHGKKGFEPQPIVLFNTTDSGSGISHYEVKIGDGDKNRPERTAPSALSNPYPLPPQFPGDHIVLVTAYDLAGNSITESSDFTIESIDTPKITSYPEELEAGDILKIRGTTYPNSDLDVHIYEDKRLVHEESARSNSLGDFSAVVTKRLGVGVYTFSIRVTDDRGAKSNETAPLTVVVKSKFFTQIASFVLEYLSGAILFLVLIFSLFIMGAVLCFRSARLIRRLRRESLQTEKMLEKSFNLLSNDIALHINRLKKAKKDRNLTKEEIKFLEDFERNLAEAEGILSKEIKDMLDKNK